jgi:hypothetical protein
MYSRVVRSLEYINTSKGSGDSYFLASQKTPLKSVYIDSLRGKNIRDLKGLFFLFSKSSLNTLDKQVRHRGSEGKWHNTS